MGDNSKLRDQLRDGEQTLEELGQQLSWSKLQVTAMKDETTTLGEWQQDSEATSCGICLKEFGLARRKHHCRNCGGIFCGKCSDNQMKLPSSAKPLRGVTTATRCCWTATRSFHDSMIPSQYLHFHSYNYS